MKKELLVKTKIKNYKIIIEKNCSKKFFESQYFNTSKTFIIIDKKIFKNFYKFFKKNKNLTVIKINGSEKIKSFEMYKKIILMMLKNNIDRSSTIIAIGGGTIGDLAGFIASTVLRGVKFILIPSTLLSQVDSSIGGKNGINSIFGKNLVGTFLQPDKVLIDPELLKSLPIKQIKSGYAEILKHALINNKNFYLWLKIHYKNIFTLKPNVVIEAIYKSIKIKKKYVENDEKEVLINSSSRAILNFGHTFGHALEATNNYKTNLTHGEAISIGMIIESKISNKLNMLNNIELEDIINHFKSAGLKIHSSHALSNKIFKIISKDKKNTLNKINLILLKKIGVAYYKRGLSIKGLKKIIK